MDPTPPPRPLRADAERNRRLILETARAAFADRGLGVRLDEIAELAGVGVGTVYRRFKDKDELVRALFEQVVAEIVAIGDEALTQPGGGGLRWFFDRVVTRMAADRALQQLLTSRPATSGGLAELGHREIEPRVRELAARAHAAGTLRRDVAHTDIPVLQLMMTAVIDATAPVRPELWRRYVGLLFDALEPRPGDRPLEGEPPGRDDVILMLDSWQLAPRRAGARG